MNLELKTKLPEQTSCSQNVYLILKNVKLSFSLGKNIKAYLYVLILLRKTLLVPAG